MGKNLLALDKKADYATLREWCITIYDFLLLIEPKCIEWISLFKDLIYECDKNRDIKKIKALYNETNALIKDDMLSQEEMNELNEILSKKFRHSIEDEVNFDTKSIQEIIKCGKIRNDREFELVKNREEEIYADDSQWDYVEKLRELMSDYEDHKNRPHDQCI